MPIENSDDAPGSPNREAVDGPAPEGDQRPRSAQRRFRSSETTGGVSKAGAVGSAALGLTLASVILYLCVPILGSALAGRSGEAALDKLVTGAPFGAEDVVTIVRSNRRALAWREAPDAWAGLATGYVLAAEFREGSNARAELMEKERQALEESLGRAPLRPDLWLQFGINQELRILMEGAAEETWSTVAHAAGLAALTGPGLASQAVAVAELALVSEPYWSDAEEATLEGHIRRTWDREPRHLAEDLALRAASLEALPVLQTALGDDAVRNGEIEAIFESQWPDPEAEPRDTQDPGATW